MEKLKENLEKWSFIEKYRHLDDLSSTLEFIEEGCEHLKNRKIIGASVSFYEASEKLEFLHYCEKHGEEYIDSVYREETSHYLDELYEDGFYYEQDYNNKSYKINYNYNYNYLMDKYLVSIDAKDLSEFSEKFYSCLKHLESIDFSEFDLCLNPNDIYADDLPNGCKEGDEFISFLNVFSDFVKENVYSFPEDQLDVESLLSNYKNRNYVYVGKALKDKIDTFSFSSVDDIDLFMDDYERMLYDRRNCFRRFYFVACALELKKIS